MFQHLHKCHHQGYGGQSDVFLICHRLHFIAKWVTYICISSVVGCGNYACIISRWIFLCDVGNACKESTFHMAKLKHCHWLYSAHLSDPGVLRSVLL